MGLLDAIYCINLARRPERWSMFLQRFPTDSGLPKVRRIAGVDGQKLPCDFSVTPGTLGCLESHKIVLRQAIQEHRSAALVLEDDVLFRPDFAGNLAALMDQVPDEWDQVYLGGNHRKPPTWIAPGLLRCSFTTGGYAYLISADGARKLLARLDGWRGHVDQAYGRMHASGDAVAYAPERWLCGHSGGLSDILGFSSRGRAVESFFDFEEAVLCQPL